MRRLLTWIPLCAALAAAHAHAQVPDAIKDKVAVCAQCHGETGNNNDPQFPVLAGQSARYIYTELQDFKAGRRHDPNMDPVAQALSREDMLALADYFSKQKQASSNFKA